MKIKFSILFAAALVCGANATTQYLGIFIQGHRVGYSSYSEEHATLNGKPVKKTNSLTKVSANLLGTPMNVTVQATTLSSPSGKPIQMSFATDSAGRKNILIANFDGKIVKLMSNESGTIDHSSIALPNGPITDDPMEGLIFGKLKGYKKKVYVLDPTLQNFVANEVIYKGPKTIKLNGKEVKAIWIEVQDPRAATEVYVDSKGNLIRANSAMDMTMLPMSKFEALKGFGTSKIDLAYGNKIIPNGNLVDPANLKSLDLIIHSSESYAKLPSDENQTVTGNSGNWNVNIHPVTYNRPAGATIDEAKALMPKWVLPGDDIPSNEAKFTNLAKSIIGKTTDVGMAARKIQLWVNNEMTPDASIAVLRNANEVLASKRGVCRDYAILTATLLRAAGIPCQLATGLVSWDGDFYYHAWVKFFDGKNWVGLDSTTSGAQLSATHIELACGNVSQAYMAPFLQSPTITVVSESE